jgi:integrase
MRGVVLEEKKKKGKNQTGKGSRKIEPIRNQKDIDKMISYLMDVGRREFMLFFLGINIFLRVSDLVKLKRSDFVGGYLVVREKKTTKEKKQKISKELWNELLNYFELENIGVDDYLFTSKKMKYKPLSSTTALKIIQDAANKLGLFDIGTPHSMRKTFGYHYYKETGDLELLRGLFNLSAQSVTAIYIGFTQDDFDRATENFALGVGALIKNEYKQIHGPRIETVR